MECSDSERTFYPQRVVCYASMELASAEAAYDALHEKRPYHDGTFTRWAEHRSREFPYHARDGVTFFVADEDVNPEDRFTTETNAIPEGVDDGNSP